MPIDTEVEYIKNLIEKMDVSLEKITQVSNDVGRLLAVHDERISQLERSSDRKSDDIKELHQKLSEQTKEILEKLDKFDDGLHHKLSTNIQEIKQKQEICVKELNQKIDDLDDRIEKIEKWKWYVLGAVGIVGFIVGNLNDLIHFLK